MGLFSSVIKKMDIEEKEAYSAEEKKAIEDVCLATMALSTYVAASDGTITIDEYMESDMNIASINKQFQLSDELMHTIKDMSMNHGITWKEVTAYLDELSVEALNNMKGGLENVINASDGKNEAEEKVLQEFDAYIQSRS